MVLLLSSGMLATLRYAAWTLVSLKYHEPPRSTLYDPLAGPGGFRSGEVLETTDLRQFLPLDIITYGEIDITVLCRVAVTGYEAAVLVAAASEQF